MLFLASDSCLGDIGTYIAYTLAHLSIVCARTSNTLVYSLSSITYIVTGESAVYFVYGCAIITTSPRGTGTKAKRESLSIGVYYV